MESFKKGLSLFAILLILPTNTLAFQAVAEEELIVTERVDEDFYATGGSVKILSDVDGDLSVAGAEIEINGKITKDVILLAGDAKISGSIDDDVHVAAGNVYMNSQVNGDAMIATGVFDMDNQSVIAGDLAIAAGEVKLNGNINGDVYGVMGKIYINGLIRGNLKLYDVSKIKFGPKGRINGDLIYSSPNQINAIQSENIEGKINYNAPLIDFTKKSPRSSIARAIGRFSFMNFLALLALGLFIVWGFKYYLVNATSVAYRQPFASFATGLFVVIFMPVLGLITLISGIGYLVSFVLFLTWLIVLIFGGVAGSATIGYWLMSPKKNTDFWRMYSAFALGALIYTLLTFVPFIGWITQFILSMIGIGAMGIYEMELGKLLRKKKLI